ncbi:MAG: glycosyltransferase family 4 protein [Gammaproteobacteria bacterium]|nr:glycosyltransferase family 4 protein [Gammaproteobacteria bacterium]
MSLKILELCLSSGYGGLELYVNKVTNYFLSSKKYDVLAVLKQNSFLDQKLSSQSIKKRYLKTINRHIPIIAAYKLAKLLDMENINIIHVHWGKDLFLAVLAKTFCKKPVKIMYMRQMALTRHKRDIYHTFLYKNVDAYQVITRTLYNDAIKFLPLQSEKIHLLYYGVPEGTRCDSCKDYLGGKGVDPSSFKVAIFGRVEEGKGQHLVIQAVKNIYQNRNNISLSIIGHVMDQAYYKKLENLANIKSNKQFIHFLGFHENPTSIMSCFDVVVLATRCETFGLVLPEAMRAETAVIGSNCGGVPEIIVDGETGLLFESDDAVGLERALDKLVSDKEFCNRLAKNGKNYADKQFSEELHYKNLDAIINQLDCNYGV